MTQADVIAVLEQMAVLLELAGENPFKVRAYANGARALEAYDGPWPDAAALGQVKGLGKGLMADILALASTGRLEAYEQLVASTPAGLVAMIDLPGLGPKKVRAIHEGLGIATIGELEYACLENRLLDLPGFGEKTQAKVLAGIARWKENRGRFLYADVIDQALACEQALAQGAGLLRVAIAGDLRRQLEIVEAGVLLVRSDGVEAVIAAMQATPGLQDLTQPGPDVLAARLENGLPVRVQLVLDDASWAGALLHHTGSAAFVARLAERAQARSWRLDAHGLWRADGSRLPAADEAALLAHLDLAFVPPELREDRGELAIAEHGPMPALVVASDLQGIFHVHTRDSDGEGTLREMVLAARGLGYRYIGISDHSEAAVYAHGLRPDRIRAQQAEIRALGEEIEGIAVLSGIEADILADGALDYDDETLASFDFVIGSVHSRFAQDRATMTARLVRAVGHPRLTILGHMTGRLLLSRDPYDFDRAAVLEAAARHGKVIELNANPHRLDIDWRDVPQARALGIPIAINPDAHSPRGLEDTRFGVAAARKGGLAPAEVFNTWPLERVQAFLAASRARA